MMMKHLPILLIYLENNYVGGPSTDTVIYTCKKPCDPACLIACVQITYMYVIILQKGPPDAEVM